MAARLEEVEYRTKVTGITGATAFGGGLGLAAVRLVLAPITFGVSAIFGLTIASGFGSAGAATGITSAVTKEYEMKKVKKAIKQIMEKYEKEKDHMKTVSAKFEEICLKEMDSLDDLRYHGNSTWKEGNAALLPDLCQHVRSLSNIHKRFEKMLTKNNITVKNQEGEESINLSEIMAVIELLDRYDGINERIHAFMTTDDLHTSHSKPVDDDLSDFYVVDVDADALPGPISASRKVSIFVNKNILH